MTILTNKLSLISFSLTIQQACDDVKACTVGGYRIGGGCEKPFFCSRCLKWHPFVLPLHSQLHVEVAVWTRETDRECTVKPAASWTPRARPSHWVTSACKSSFSANRKHIRNLHRRWHCQSPGWTEDISHHECHHCTSPLWINTICPALLHWPDTHNSTWPI